jgi:ATPase subunit of ABC transporter with duplicated ATPase domains
MYIQANKISKNFSGTPLFENLTLQINENEKIGLVGQNGTGKTTLFQLLLGIEGIDEGVISRKKGVSIGWVPQQLTMSDRTAFEYISHSFVGLHEL